MWDRTPTEPAGHLSYQDILELKAIQRTLPRAQQLPDMYTGKPAHHFLQHVPIGLLPLTDQSSPSISPLSTPHSTPVSTPDGSPTNHSPPNHSPPLCDSPHHGPWHAYAPSTTSPLAASALAAAFASKPEKPTFPNKPIPSNLGPKFVPPTTPPVTVTCDTPTSPLSPTTPQLHHPIHIPPPICDNTPTTCTPSTPTEAVNSPFLLGSNDDLSSSSSSSYASDSEHESSGYTGGSPLSRTTSMTSVSTLGSDKAGIGSAYAEPDEPGFFLIPPSKRACQLHDSKHSYFGDDMPSFAAKDPRLRAVASPVLAPPSPLNLDGRPSSPALETDLAKSMRERLERVSVPSPLILDGPRRAPLEEDLAKAMQERLERVELERQWELSASEAEVLKPADHPDVLDDAEPFSRTSSKPVSERSSSSASREPSRERAGAETDREEIERFRRQRLGKKWTPPSSRGPSRDASRAPSTERNSNVVEINGVVLQIDLDGGD
ncbi:hypothetical protein BDP27DRAFT_1359111 [Rhodocollybia butyracea]|uniref:Uncharacterized protein n=1 Tax=Rhodocollybia butyracea TaxID=206335 RepID=A0A9P5UD72_9AGAR|nr:hypothetical protein BDP27DRAFT_1359111 [Rhodocollybia butyracea]